MNKMLNISNRTLECQLVHISLQSSVKQSLTILTL